MAINLRIEALNYPNQQDPCFSITVEPVPCQPVPAIPAQESFCAFCLRERPPDGAFYGYNIENCPILRETMEEIFGPRFKLEKFSICTPCWNMVQLLDDFRTCCFEANSRVGRIKRGINGDEDDGWFTEETVKGIEGLHGTIRDQIELIKAFEEIPEPSTENDVITIDSDSDDESIHDLVIDETILKQEHSEDPIEMILESEQQPVLQDRSEDVVEVLPEIVQPPIVIYDPEQAIEKLPEVEHQPAVLDRPEHAIETLTVGELQLTFHELPEEDTKTDNTSTIKVEQPQEQQQTSLQDQVQAVIENSSPLPSIKVEPEEPDDNPLQLTSEHPTDNVVPEDPTPSSNLPEISTSNIKTEVMLPEESMEVDNADLSPPEDNPEAQDISPSEILFSEISVENIKVESDGVGEKIAKLVNARVSQCGRCGRSFSCLKGTHRHLQNCRHQESVAGTAPDGDDVNAVMYTCQICWASYRSKTNFRAHINQHAGFKQYRCRLMCKKQFFGLKGRIKHEVKCNAYIGCAVCERPFTTKESLFAHIKEAHGKIAFKCEICGTSFNNRINLRNHQRNMHKEKEGGFMCRRCRKHRSKTAHEANLHLYECNEIFTYNCDQCDAQLRNFSLLRAHKERFHEEPSYGCNFCNKKFKQKSSALKHQASHTEHQGRFRCINCPKILSTLANLKRHMNVHFPVRHFQCHSCHKQFSSKQTMESHLKNVCSKRSQGDSLDVENQVDEV